MLDTIKSLEVDLRPRLSRWISDKNRQGYAPIIHDHELAEVRSLPPLSFTAKADRVLEFLVHASKQYGQRFSLPEVPALQSQCETFDPNSLGFFGQYLVERGYLEDQMQTQKFRVTGEGFSRVEKLGSSVSESKQGFVAMWFDPSLDDIWQHGLSEGIQAAGYLPMRIDGKEHNFKICDQIVAEIRRSRFIVADFTGHRGGVYYEAGFAGGLNIPVIFTCRKDCIDDLHFDVRQFNTIAWNDAADLAKRLTARICATIGDGPNKK